MTNNNLTYSTSSEKCKGKLLIADIQDDYGSLLRHDSYQESQMEVAFSLPALSSHTEIGGFSTDNYIETPLNDNNTSTGFCRAATAVDKETEVVDSECSSSPKDNTLITFDTNDFLFGSDLDAETDNIYKDFFYVQATSAQDSDKYDIIQFTDSLDQIQYPSNLESTSIDSDFGNQQLTNQPSNMTQDKTTDLTNQYRHLKHAQELTEDEIATLPVDHAGVVMSVGSLAHETGTCKPCAFNNKPKGCLNGIQCTFCHFTHLPKKKTPRPSKYQRLLKKLQAAQLSR